MFPVFIENSKVPDILSKVSPIQIKAISLLFWVFVKGTAGDRLKNHERIHYAQWKECWFIFFPLLYVGYYIRNLIRGQRGSAAYRSNPFEIEAYSNEDNLFYVVCRPKFAWRKYDEKGIDVEKI